MSFVQDKEKKDLTLPKKEIVLTPPEIKKEKTFQELDLYQPLEEKTKIQYLKISQI